MNKRKLQQRLNVLASQKKPRRSVKPKLKLLKLLQLPRLIGCARKQRNSRMRKMNLKRKLQDWQHLKKLKHL